MSTDGITLEEGAKQLVAYVLSESDPEKRLKETLAWLRSAQTAAIHEAAIILSLGGIAALHRLFQKYGLKIP